MSHLQRFITLRAVQPEGLGLHQLEVAAALAAAGQRAARGGQRREGYLEEVVHAYGGGRMIKIRSRNYLIYRFFIHVYQSPVHIALLYSIVTRCFNFGTKKTQPYLRC